MLVSRQVILLGIEGTTGTAETLDQTDAILVNSLSLTNSNARMIERPVIKKSMTPLPQVFGGTLKQLQFSCEVKGGGTAGLAPEIGQALQACGLLETINQGTSAIYTTTSENIKSATIEVYQDGNYHQLVGCRGTVNFTINAGEIITADFTFTGHYSEHKDKVLPTVTYSETVPAPIINLENFKVGGNKALASSLTIDVGNNIITPADITNKYGFGEIRISTRDITGTVDPEMGVITSSVDYLKFWMDGKAQKIETGDIGATAGNIISFELPKTVLREYANGDRDGLITETLSFGAHEVSGTDDQELKIIFT